MSSNEGERVANGSPEKVRTHNGLTPKNGDGERRTGCSPFGPRKNPIKSMRERRTGRTYKGTALVRRPYPLVTGGFRPHCGGNARRIWFRNRSVQFVRSYVCAPKESFCDGS